MRQLTLATAGFEKHRKLTRRAAFLAETLRRVLDYLLTKYDIIIIDTPAVLVGGDTEALARVVEQTIFLVRWRYTAPEHVALAINRLAGTGAKIAGMVLSRVDTSQNARYDHAEALLFSHEMRTYYK